MLCGARCHTTTDFSSFQHDNRFSAIQKFIGNRKAGDSCANYGHIGALGTVQNWCFSNLDIHPGRTGLLGKNIHVATSTNQPSKIDEVPDTREEPLASPTTLKWSRPRRKHGYHPANDFGFDVLCAADMAGSRVCR